MSSELDRRFRRFYTNDAATYDRRFSGATRAQRYAELENDLIIDLIRPRPGMTLLDVGAGTGRASLALAAREDARVIALDITPAMLRQARLKRDASGLRFPDLVCANARMLPFPDNSFDAVVSIRVLHLFPTDHLRPFVREMRRVLRPGGTLLIEFNSPFAGAGWIIARELARRAQGAKERHYVWPHQLPRLFAGLEQREVFGFWFPGLGRVAEFGGPFEAALRHARLSPPYGFLGSKILVKARKPSEQASADPLAENGRLTIPEPVLRR